jgi:hypothetical protein
MYSTNAATKNLNHQMQRSSQQPVFKVVADHSETAAEKATATEAGLLKPFLELSIGCKLMILENIWTERGIVNGAQCRLYDIVWPEDSDPTKETPTSPSAYSLVSPNHRILAPRSKNTFGEVKSMLLCQYIARNAIY